MHPEKGVSCFHFHEVVPKQAAIGSAGQRILVTDGSKFGVIRPAFFASLDEFDIIVTDAEAGQHLQHIRPVIEQAGAPRVMIA